MARSKVIHKESGIGEIVKYSNNCFGSEDYYIIRNTEGECVHTIPQRIMCGNLHKMLHEYVKKC